MFSRCCTFDTTLRNIVELKNVRLKSSSDSLKTRLPGEVIKSQGEILCKILNCNAHTAGEIIEKSGEREFSQHNFYKNAKFCKKYLKQSDVVEFPSLLSMPPSLLQHRYFSLKELGFCNVTAKYILKFTYILKKTPQELKKKGTSLTFEYKSNILSDYLNRRQRTEVNNKLQHMYTDGSSFQKIKEVMNAEFLSAKLECSIGKAHQMFHRNAALRIQSILNTDQLLDVLLYKCGFSIPKIHRSITITVLSVHHEAVEHFLSEFPEILGVDTLFLIRRLPLLLKQENKSIRETEDVLKDFNISSDQLKCCPKLLAFTPGTIRKRLTALFNTEEFAVMKSHKKFLWLVYYYKNLNSRLKSLEAENLPASISIFTATKDTFEKYLLYNNNTRRGVREIYMYLAEVFKKSEKEIYFRLRHCSYLQSEDQKFSTLNCRRVIEFLLISGVTKTQIFNGLEIVYFNADAVKCSFNMMKNHPLCQPYEEWASHCNFIQLLIYIIETTKYHLYNTECDEHYLELSSN